MNKHYNIPIFIPHLGCPFQCIFCNQVKISSTEKVPTPADVITIIEKHLKTIPVEAGDVEIAFFGGNFTAVPRESQQQYLQAAAPFLNMGRIKNIRLSTRPDCIDQEELNFLAKWGVTTIELGVQSMDDEVLRLSRRGYLAKDVSRACHLLKKNGFKIGIQLMIGLPGDCYRRDLETTRKIIDLQPDMVRIYPTLVIRDTPLQQMWMQGLYTPLTLERAIAVSGDILLLLQYNNIKVIRIGLQAGEDLNQSETVVTGPYHPSFGELVEQKIFRDQARQLINEFLTNYSIDGLTGIKLFVNEHDISKMTGHKKNNTHYLKEILQLSSLEIIANADMGRNVIGTGGINDTYPRIMLNRRQYIKTLGW